MKKITKHLFLLTFSIILFSCKKSGNNQEEFPDEDVIPLKVFSETTIMTNANDPLFIAIPQCNDELVQVFGKRDENGIPIHLTNVYIKKATGDLLIGYNEENKINSFVASNGVKLQLDWLNSMTVVATVTSSDGEIQVKTPVNFAVPFQKSSSSITKGSRKELSTRSKLIFHPSTEKSINKTSYNNKVKIAAKTCDQIIDIKGGIVEVGFSSGNFRVELLPQKENDNEWYVNIPRGNALEVHENDMCQTLSELLIKIYETENYSLLKEVILSAIDLTDYPSSFKSEVLKAIDEFLKYYKVFCDVREDNSPNQIAEVVRNICNHEFEYRSFNEEIKIQALIDDYEETIVSEIIVVKKGELIPDIFIVIPGKPKIQNFYADPIFPASNMDYQAIAEVSCLPWRTKVEIAVSGSDDYENSALYEMDDDIRSGTFELWVPGSEKGVRDKLTLTITLPNGSKIIKKMSLVFS